MKRTKKRSGKKDSSINSARALYHKNTSFCVLADILFIVLLIFIFMIGTVIASKSMEEFVQVAPQILSLKQSVLSQSGINVEKPELQEMKDIIDRMARNIIIIVIFTALAIILLTGLIKGFIWSRVTRQRFSPRFFAKFLLVNLIWLGFWFIASALVLLKVRVPANVYILILLSILVPYLTLLLYSNFSPKKSIIDVFKRSATLIFRKNVLNYLLIFLAFIVFSNIVVFAVVKSSRILITTGLLLFLIALHWSRIYFFSSIRS